MVFIHHKQPDFSNHENISDIYFHKDSIIMSIGDCVQPNNLFVSSF